MKTKLINYVGNKLIDAIEWIMSLKPEDENYTDEDRKIMKRSKEMRKDFK